jgi:hypothetical protein
MAAAMISAPMMMLAFMSLALAVAVRLAGAGLGVAVGSLAHVVAPSFVL